MFKKLLTRLLFSLMCLWQSHAYANQTHEDDNHTKEKVVMLLSAHDHGYWTGEVIDAYDVLKKAGVEVVFTTPDGAVGIPSGMWTLDKNKSDTFRSLAKQLASPQSLAKLDHADFDAIYIPGGSGPMFDLYNHPTVNIFIKDLYQTNKPIAAVCHGPAALAGVRLDNGNLLIEGKKITGKSNAEEDEWARKNYFFML